MSVLMPYSEGQYERETYRRLRLWIFAHTTVVSTDLTPFYLSRHSCPSQLSSAQLLTPTTGSLRPAICHLPTQGCSRKQTTPKVLGLLVVEQKYQRPEEELRAASTSSSTTTQVGSADVCVLRHGAMLAQELSQCVRTTMILLWKEFTIVQKLGKQGYGPSTAY